MFSQVWRVGLDIQNQYVRALAVQRRRSGWQLRHWWQQELPHPVLREGYLDESDTLVTILKQWRSRLPRHISLRIALPAQRVLQHTLPLPDFRLREPIRHNYIISHGIKQFPLDSQTLVVDYRQASQNSDHLLLTAARQQELQQWLDYLLQAGLQPEVVDIAPCALSAMAGAAGLSQDVGLLHRLESDWLWVAPRTEAFTYGVLPIREAESLEQALGVIGVSCPALARKGVYYSSVIDEVLAEEADVILWSPFTVFNRLYPPLPILPMAFVLAGGLALRGEDN